MTTELPRSSRPAVGGTRPVPMPGTGEPGEGQYAADGRAAAEYARERPTEQPTQHPTEPVSVVVPRRLGRYELLERVGEGGMGVVWRAADRRHPGREVAIKVLRPHIAHDEGARERLRREVHTLARVHHPQVAAVLDADVDGPAPYIVTDFVPGPPLDAVVDEEGPLHGEELLGVARGLASALHAIHEVGIVHRDLKPGNVLLVGEPGAREPVVIDFGIAQLADDVRLTSTGLVMGTPGYLSPEIAEGGAVSRATDWWGWAATLAYAASGHPPFGRGPITVVLDRVSRGRLQLDGVDPGLRPLLAAALDPDPARRPTEDQVLDGLERYARHEDVTGALPVLPPDPEWGAGADQTHLHELTDPTQVAPQRTVARTRRTPVSRPYEEESRAQDPGPGWREPAPRPEHYGPAGHEGYHDGYAEDPYGFAEDPYGPEQPELDPRIGRRARTGTLTAMLAAFVGLAAVVPLVAWGLYALWAVGARTVDRTVTGLVLRRHRAGKRATDVPVTVLASPVHLVVATVSTAFSLLLPVAMAAVVALVFSGLVTSTELLAGVGPEQPLSMAVGALVGGGLSWWGLASTSLRRGSRTTVRATVPEGAATVVLVVGCLVGAAVLGFAAYQGGDRVSWWPLPPGTTLLDLVPFTLP
ncbi:serine/threonine-protein kinase [Ornithinimicrobium pratense]|uniref:Serine/threonine protein kinase n=1 Tax=Ornithinimicrobium pratense TaxID=2593973 RepID=A0A5J6V6V5_9MICO|nr:serine/threonine-protein kinase [Ornithinimicrobium pratense]QFG69515.1 serine/threonine protein kinase [Ornithinimicrobium pratense]